MRLVRVKIAEANRADVTSFLDEESIDYALVADRDGAVGVGEGESGSESEGEGESESEGESGSEGSDRGDADGGERETERWIVEFPIPTQAVEEVIDRLRDLGVDRRYLVVLNAESVDTDRFDRLEDRFVSGSEEGDEVAHREIRTKALDMNPGWRTYLVMTVLSVLVATVGLLLDSAALVVGSMVIAPQVASAMTAAVGIVIDETEMIREGLVTQVVGLAVAIAGAAAFGWIVRTAGFVPPALNVTTITQISSRTSPGVLSLVVGLSAGIAGALGLATALPVSLVGVMVAAALVPAAAAVGIGVAWGYPLVALGALVLLIVNMATINLGAAGALWSLDYRPEGWEEWQPLSNLAAGRGVHSLLAVVLVLAVFAATGVVLVDHVSFENDANRAVSGVLATDRYDDLTLVSMRADFVDYGVFDDGREVTVIVSRPADRPLPGLADRLESRIGATTGRHVSVKIEFQEQQRADRSNSLLGSSSLGPLRSPARG